MKNNDFPLNIPASVFRFSLNTQGRMSFDFRVMGMNDLFVNEDLKGEISEESLRQFIITDDWASFMESITQSYINLTEWSCEFFLRRKDGTQTRVLAKSNPVKQEDGCVVWDGIAIDISKQYEADQKSRELQSRLQKLESQVPGGIYQYQLFPDGRTVLPYASDKCREYLNVKNKGVFEDASIAFGSMHPDDVAALRQSIMKSYNELSYWKSRFRICYDDGSFRWLSANSTPEKQDDGSVIWTGFITDVTTEVEAEKKIAEWQQFFQNTFMEHSAMMVILDPDNGTIVDVNKSAAEFYGYSVDEIKGMPISIINTLPEDEMKLGLIKARSKEQREFIVPHKKRNGERCSILVHTVPVTFENRKLFSSILTDVTEKLKAEEALQKSQADLKRSNADLENFAYVASHDLKEPLRMISSFIGLIEKKSGNLFDEKAKQYFWFVTDAVSRMRNMIDELLKYSQVGRKHTGFQLTDVNDLLESQLRLFQRTIADKKCNVQVQKLPVIMCNPTLVEELFHNLLGNALKFSDKELTQIEVGVEKGEQENRFFVKDNGIGISTSHHAEIFAMFRRLHSTKEYEGSGIGLALCKRIVEYHQGKIWVESEPGKGSCFWFSIPVSMK